ncbi:MAG: hypothetical protein OQK24_03475 [Magnetovibrio sp.]|nr:hypothetical protein [Magnetovibrio sp.]
MVRIIFTYVLPLALPTLIYIAWTLWVRNKVRTNRAKAKAEGLDVEQGDHTHVGDYDLKMPWVRLVFAGVGLMMVALVLSVMLSPKNPEDSIYVPPHMDGDKIVPGQFLPRNQ